MSYRSGSNDTALDSTGTSHSFVSSEPASSMPGEYSYVATQRRLFFLYTAVTTASVDMVRLRSSFLSSCRRFASYTIRTAIVPIIAPAAKPIMLVIKTISPFLVAADFPCYFQNRTTRLLEHDPVNM